MNALSQKPIPAHSQGMINLPDTDGMDMKEAAAAWAALNLRLCYENERGQRPVGGWRYTDRSKTRLLNPDSPERARHLVDHHSITRLLVEPAENMVVLDIDHRPDRGWDAKAIGKELRQRFQLPTCPIVKTPSGGFHLWLELPEGFTARNWTSQHGKFPIDGVDVRTHGGLAVSPPSTRSPTSNKAGGNYEWIGVCRTLPIATPALVEALTPAEIEEQPVGKARAYQGDISLYCKAALECELSAVAHCGKGGRNHQLFVSSAALASIVAAGGLPEQATRQALLEMAKHNGLVKDDGINSVVATINSGFATGCSSPRALPQSEGAT